MAKDIYIVVETDGNGDVLWVSPTYSEYDAAVAYAERCSKAHHTNYWVVDLHDAILRCSV